MKFRVLFTALILTFSLAAWSQKDIADQDIADAIETEYMLDHAINTNNIDIGVTAGVAELEGKVSTISAKERAANIAEMVKGVRSVSNRIEVEPQVLLGDDAIESKVTVALFNDPGTESYEVDVSALSGLVTLTGTVDSYREKHLAGNVAKSVVGVRGVSNKIEIDPDITRPDAELKSEIESALKWSVLVDDALIDVYVKDREVSLEGTVGSLAEKEDAKYLALISGVISVDAEKLDVEWWAKDTDLRRKKDVFASDEDIENAVKDAALLDPRLNSFDIEVESNNGWVTLRGEVSNLKAHRTAENIAEYTMGVKDVTNRIKVKIEVIPTDQEIRDNILNALAQNAITESYEILVNVNAGVVTLSGLVDSYVEKMEAEWVASGVDGVTSVVNTITVNTSYSHYYWDASPYYEWYYVPSSTTEVITVTAPNDTKIKNEVESQLWWSPYVDSEDINVTVDNGFVELTGTANSVKEFNKATENAWEGGAWDVDNSLVIE